MMKIHGSLQNTIFTFIMIRKMILNLFNIISNYIGNTWWTMDMHRNVIRCGMMVVHISLRVANHGILCWSIQTWRWAIRCARFFSGVVMGKVPMTRLGLASKGSFKDDNSSLMLWNYKMLKKWLHSYVNVCRIGLSHHTLVYENHQLEFLAV